ncbi:MAG: hydroxymethylpyrimidine/phosphomethylpyrimidine kinase [Bacteroidota bacterium]
MTYALTIAGHDPSGGAGLTADLKTFEAHGIYGFSVCSAITVQNDMDFDMVEWVDGSLIKKQIAILFERFQIGFIKIGIIKNFETLNEILDFLLMKNPKIKIVWDPVLKASAGFEFHKAINEPLLLQILEKCYLTTPNKEEWGTLFYSLTGNRTPANKTNVLVKGGHDIGDDAVDLLYKDGVILPISGPRLEGDKHGTGCVLSSAITANLANGETLETSCYRAKQYISKFISSNNTLLGQHHYA